MANNYNGWEEEPTPTESWGGLFKRNLARLLSKTDEVAEGLPGTIYKGGSSIINNIADQSLNRENSAIPGMPGQLLKALTELSQQAGNKSLLPERATGANLLNPINFGRKLAGGESLRESLTPDTIEQVHERNVKLAGDKEYLEPQGKVEKYLDDFSEQLALHAAGGGALKTGAKLAAASTAARGVARDLLDAGPFGEFLAGITPGIAQTLWQGSKNSAKGIETLRKAKEANMQKNYARADKLGEKINYKPTGVAETAKDILKTIDDKTSGLTTSNSKELGIQVKDILESIAPSDKVLDKNAKYMLDKLQHIRKLMGSEDNPVVRKNLERLSGSINSSLQGLEKKHPDFVEAWQRGNNIYKEIAIPGFLRKLFKEDSDVEKAVAGVTKRLNSAGIGGAAAILGSPVKVGTGIAIGSAVGKAGKKLAPIIELYRRSPEAKKRVALAFKGAAEGNKSIVKANILQLADGINKQIDKFEDKNEKYNGWEEVMDNKYNGWEEIA